MLINVFPQIVFVRTFFLHISRGSNNIYIVFFNYICIDLFIRIINFINDDCKLNLYVSLIMTLICLDPCQWSLMSLITGNKVKKHTSQGTHGLGEI